MSFPRWVTRTNRLLLNPLVLRFAPRVPPFAVVHHRGRRSGRAYDTPVMAFAAPGTDGTGVRVVLALTYGRDVDWVRNVEAAGSFGLTRAGRGYEVSRLSTPTTSEGLGLVPPWTAAILRRAGVGDFLTGAIRTESRVTGPGR